ncbi:PHB depolymerase family esterase [Alienimonas chondri]|uniref:Phospholipase/carboxylesterase/thioesterase domain-containing protein n=1 Tax=Alienimonas chondri TaxID=2681879 RepID=A0ABX1VI33_9PLAN|nr:PHB depolymerase family esterase [Alienimonas chondri]NNJ27170.1 hypothetical protein [Alienimonas chondri]
MPVSRLAAPDSLAPALAAQRGAVDPLTAALTARFGRVGSDMPFVEADPLSDRRLPSAVAVPEGYEPGYAYPLVVWLHDTGSSEHTLHAVLRGVSDRNYLGLSVRGAACDAAGGTGFGWSDRAVAEVAERLPALVSAVKAEWNVHTERVYLAGLGSGADAAAALLTARPEWFAGAALLAGGTLPPMDCGPTALAGKRILLCGEDGRRSAPTVLAAAAGWRETGARAEVRLTNDEPMSPAALRAVDRWLMAGVAVGV